MGAPSIDQFAASGKLILRLPVADSAMLKESKNDWCPKGVESQDRL